MLTGQAKKDYQREYMRRRRAKLDPVDVRPKLDPPVRPIEYETIIINGTPFRKPVYIEHKR